jgi:hypothetical protein
MKTFKVHVTWTMGGTVLVEAEDENEAYKKGLEATPEDCNGGDYMDDSWDIVEVEEDESAGGGQ